MSVLYVSIEQTQFNSELRRSRKNYIMKKYLVALLLSMIALNSIGQDTPKGPPPNRPDGPPRHERPALTDAQKKLLAEMTVKYDVNKDGKMDREERRKMSPADHKAMMDAGLVGPPGGPRRAGGPPPPVSDTNNPPVPKK